MLDPPFVNVYELGSIIEREGVWVACRLGGATVGGGGAGAAGGDAGGGGGGAAGDERP